MDDIVPQRVDIAQIVGEFHGKTTHEARDDVPDLAVPTVRPARTARRTSEPTGPWYVVADEILEGRVTLEAWPWPAVNDTTGFLSFDLSQTERFTREAVDVHAAVSRHRAAGGGQIGAERPLRIGDVFEVSAAAIDDLSTWTSVRDHTAEKRAEARAALDAMAAPPHSPDHAARVERMADEIEEPDAGPVDSTRAHAAV